MHLVEERLTNLWLREANQIHPAELMPEPEKLPNTISVTFKSPMMLSGAVLKPGRYVFQVPDPNSRPEHVEIFNSDQSEHVADILVADATPRWDGWN